MNRELYLTSGMRAWLSAISPAVKCQSWQPVCLPVDCQTYILPFVNSFLLPFFSFRLPTQSVCPCTHSLCAFSAHSFDVYLTLSCNHALHSSSVVYAAYWIYSPYCILKTFTMLRIEDILHTMYWRYSHIRVCVELVSLAAWPNFL